MNDRRAVEAADRFFQGALVANITFDDIELAAGNFLNSGQCLGMAVAEVIEDHQLMPGLE